MIGDYLIDSPSPQNLSSFWSFGSLLGLTLVMLIATGVSLAMHYLPNTDWAFASVEEIQRSLEAPRSPNIPLFSIMVRSLMAICSSCPPLSASTRCLSQLTLGTELSMIMAAKLVGAGLATFTRLALTHGFLKTAFFDFAGGGALALQSTSLTFGWSANSKYSSFITES